MSFLSEFLNARLPILNLQDGERIYYLDSNGYPQPLCWESKKEGENEKIILDFHPKCKYVHENGQEFTNEQVKDSLVLIIEYLIKFGIKHQPLTNEANQKIGIKFSESNQAPSFPHHPYNITRGYLIPQLAAEKTASQQSVGPSAADTESDSPRKRSLEEFEGKSESKSSVDSGSGLALTATMAESPEGVLEQYDPVVLQLIGKCFLKFSMAASKTTTLLNLNSPDPHLTIHYQWLGQYLINSKFWKKSQFNSEASLYSATLYFATKLLTVTTPVLCESKGADAQLAVHQVQLMKALLNAIAEVQHSELTKIFEQVAREMNKLNREFASGLGEVKTETSVMEFSTLAESVKALQAQEDKEFTFATLRDATAAVKAQQKIYQSHVSPPKTESKSSSDGSSAIPQAAPKASAVSSAWAAQKSVIARFVMCVLEKCNTTAISAPEIINDDLIVSFQSADDKIIEKIRFMPFVQYQKNESRHILTFKKNTLERLLSSKADELFGQIAKGLKALPGKFTTTEEEAKEAIITCVEEGSFNDLNKSATTSFSSHSGDYPLSCELSIPPQAEENFFFVVCQSFLPETSRSEVKLNLNFVDRKESNSSPGDSKQSISKVKAEETEIKEVTVTNFINHILNLINAKNITSKIAKEDAINKGYLFCGFQVADDDKVVKIINLFAFAEILDKQGNQFLVSFDLKKLEEILKGQFYNYGAKLIHRFGNRISEHDYDNEGEGFAVGDVIKWSIDPIMPDDPSLEQDYGTRFYREKDGVIFRVFHRREKSYSGPIMGSSKVNCRMRYVIDIYYDRDGKNQVVQFFDQILKFIKPFLEDSTTKDTSAFVKAESKQQEEKGFSDRIAARITELKVEISTGLYSKWISDTDGKQKIFFLVLVQNLKLLAPHLRYGDIVKSIKTLDAALFTAVCAGSYFKTDKTKVLIEDMMKSVVSVVSADTAAATARSTGSPLHPSKTSEVSAGAAAEPASVGGSRGDSKVEPQTGIRQRKKTKDDDSADNNQDKTEKNGLGDKAAGCRIC